jgi:hypothetical protein
MIKLKIQCTIDWYVSTNIAKKRFQKTKIEIEQWKKRTKENRKTKINNHLKGLSCLD